MAWYATNEGKIFEGLEYDNIRFTADSWASISDLKFVDWAPERTEHWDQGRAVPEAYKIKWFEEISRKEITPFGGDFVDWAGATVLVDGWCKGLHEHVHEAFFEDEYDSE